MKVELSVRQTNKLKSVARFYGVSTEEAVPYLLKKETNRIGGYVKMSKHMTGKKRK